MEGETYCTCNKQSDISSHINFVILATKCPTDSNTYHTVYLQLTVLQIQHIKPVRETNNPAASATYNLYLQLTVLQIQSHKLIVLATNIPQVQLHKLIVPDVNSPTGLTTDINCTCDKQSKILMQHKSYTCNKQSYIFSYINLMRVKAVLCREYEFPALTPMKCIDWMAPVAEVRGARGIVALVSSRSVYEGEHPIKIVYWMTIMGEAVLSIQTRSFIWDIPGLSFIATSPPPLPHTHPPQNWTTYCCLLILNLWIVDRLHIEILWEFRVIASLRPSPFHFSRSCSTAVIWNLTKCGIL